MSYLKALFIRIVPFAALFAVFLSVLMQIKFGTMGDKGWLLHAAGEWVSGKKLYIDLFEVNPPLIVWIYAIPVWISRHSYFLEDYAALGVLGFCVCLLCIRLSFMVVRHHPAFEGNRYRQAMFVVMTAVGFIFLTSPVYFFDREHIMLIMTFPYMLRFAPSLARTEFPRRTRIQIGAYAAVGFCIKPHAMLVFLGLQLYYLVRERSQLVLRSTENITIYVLGALYAMIILCFAHEYFFTVLPMALQAYSHYNVRGTIHSYLPLAISSLVIPMLDFRTRFVTPFRPEVYYLLVLAGLYGIYALVNNGWGYTYHPLFSMLFFLTCWLYWEYSWLKEEYKKQGLPTRPFELGMRACFFCLGINAVYGLLSVQLLLVTPNCGGYSGCSDNTLFTDYISAHHVRSFGLMSAEFTRWPQITRESGTRWDTRFNHLWMFPALVNDGKGPSDAQEWIVNYAGSAYADDLDRRTPDIVFIDNSDEFFTTPYHIDILKVLNKVPAFAKAWGHYRFTTAIDRCASNKSDKQHVYNAREGCRYDIYTRTDASLQ